MSDYEKINATVKANLASRRKAVIKRIIILLVKALLVMAAFIGLEAIGFINVTFMVILMAVEICTTAFKAGIVYNEIKF